MRAVLRHTPTGGASPFRPGARAPSWGAFCACDLKLCAASALLHSTVWCVLGCAVPRPPLAVRVCAGRKSLGWKHRPRTQDDRARQAPGPKLSCITRHQPPAAGRRHQASGHRTACLRQLSTAPRPLFVGTPQYRPQAGLPLESQFSAEGGSATSRCQPGAPGSCCRAERDFHSSRGHQAGYLRALHRDTVPLKFLIRHHCSSWEIGPRQGGMRGPPVLGASCRRAV